MKALVAGAVAALHAERLQTMVAGARALLSIDADYFLDGPERRRAPALMDRVDALLRSGVGLSCSDDHVTLTRLPVFPIDVVVNFDQHMDCRLGYLLGDPPRIPADDATVFEALLSSRQIRRYVWAMPEARRRQVSGLYAGAVRVQRQPLLGSIHCIADWPTLAGLLSQLSIAHIFACRSPAYGTPDTDAIYAALACRRTAFGD